MRYVVLTFDDGTIYDQRFIELLNKYCLGSGDIDFTYLPTDDSPLVIQYCL